MTLFTKTLLISFILFISSVSSTRLVGYYGLEVGYANQTGCPQILTPELVPVELYTHIIYSFAFINPNHTVQEPTDNESISMIERVQNMKLRNPNVRLHISLGGWSMNMSLYSDAVSTAEGRSTLISSIISYCRKWGWDGVDFDWEYPVEPTRGGEPYDAKNYVTFIHEMRAAVEAEQIPANKTKLELSMALPGGAWYGQYYNMTSMIYDLDFANIMAYNLHGPWETQVYCSADYYDGTPVNSPYHGYSIDDAIEYFLNQSGTPLPADKFNLGVTFAGVEFVLANPANWSMGSAAIGAGPGGVCTKEAGYMAYFEVETLLDSGSISTPVFDKVGYCKYFEYQGNWVGYDDADTLSSKTQIVTARGLGGVSVWAMYAESGTGPVLQTAIAKTLFPSGMPTLPDYGSTGSSSSSSSGSGSSGSGSSSSGSSGAVNHESNVSSFVAVNFSMLAMLLLAVVSL